MASAAATLAVAVVGTVLSVASQAQAADAARQQAQAQQNLGIAQQNAADYQAKTMEIQAGQERAASQRTAIAQGRQKQLVLSRAQAIAGASGAGASDPSVITNESNIEREGTLNSLNSLYRGEQTAQGLEEGAGLKRYEGDASAYGGAASAAGTYAKADAMDTAAFGSGFSGAANAGSLYMRYNPSSGGGNTSGLVGLPGNQGSYSDPSMAPANITWG